MNIYENDRFKHLRSEFANYDFDKFTGEMTTWGKTKEEDAELFPGPTIADIEITTICTNGCEFCLVKDTMISTNKGLKPIQDIQIGEIVLSYDENTKEVVENTVKETYQHEFNGIIVNIELDNGQLIKITDNHRVYIKNFGWVEAGNLTKDMEIINV
jgi:intein/homing endonuclease